MKEISIDGVRYKLVPVEEEPKEEVVEKNPFDRREQGDTYYFICDGSKEVTLTTEEDYVVDDFRFSTANHCKDENLIQQRAYMEMLDRLLWRYAKNHNIKDLDWNNSSECKYYIFYNKQKRCFGVSYDCDFSIQGAVYFTSEDIARRALKDIVYPFILAHPDFDYENK